jgi:hypothetical protein
MRSAYCVRSKMAPELGRSPLFAEGTRPRCRAAHHPCLRDHFRSHCPTYQLHMNSKVDTLLFLSHIRTCCLLIAMSSGSLPTLSSSTKSFHATNSPWEGTYGHCVGQQIYVSGTTRYQPDSPPENPRVLCPGDARGQT